MRVGFCGNHRGRRDLKVAYRDWENIGDDISDTIQKAIELGDYDNLNRNISRTLDRVSEWVGRKSQNSDTTGNGWSQTGGTYYGGSGGANAGTTGNTWSQTGGTYYGSSGGANAGTTGGAWNQTGASSGRRRRQNKVYYTNPVRTTRVRNTSPVAGRFFVSSTYRTVSTLALILGAFFGVGFWSGIMSTLTSGVFGMGMSFWTELIAKVLSFLASLVAFVFGFSRMSLLHRFNKYRKELGTAEMCNINQLAKGVHKSPDFVRKDVEKMINKGWFCQGHLDEQKTCLMVTDGMYNKYRLLETRKREANARDEGTTASAGNFKDAASGRKDGAKKSEGKETSEAGGRNTAGLSPEVKDVIVRGEEYVRRIRACNDAIPGEEISEKIAHIEGVVNKIFDRVLTHPESVDDIRKMMEYYLPITVKLLDAYAQMDAQDVGGENILSAKKEIETTLDTLNAAFEKLLDSLFQDTAWDVSSDISVLNAMLAQEGLKDDGLKSDNGKK